MTLSLAVRLQMTSVNLSLSSSSIYEFPIGERVIRLEQNKEMGF